MISLSLVNYYFRSLKKIQLQQKFMRLNVFLRMRQGLEQRRSRPTQARSIATSAEAEAKAQLRKARFLHFSKGKMQKAAQKQKFYILLMVLE